MLKKDNWQGKATGMVCERCTFFVPKAGVIGRCRRHAPTLGGYPVVFTTDWCGDFKLEDFVQPHTVLDELTIREGE